MKNLKQELLELADLNRTSMVSEVSGRLSEIAARLPETLSLGTCAPVMSWDVSDAQRDEIAQRYDEKYKRAGEEI